MASINTHVLSHGSGDLRSEHDFPGSESPTELQSRCWVVLKPHLETGLGKDLLPSSCTWLWQTPFLVGCWTEGLNGATHNSLQWGSLCWEAYNVAAGFTKTCKGESAGRMEVTALHYVITEVPSTSSAIFYWLEASLGSYLHSRGGDYKGCESSPPSNRALGKSNMSLLFGKRGMNSLWSLVC